MDPFDDTVRSILLSRLPTSPARHQAERVADEYRDDFRRYQGRWVAMDALLRELA